MAGNRVKKRHVELDILKGIGIILVVIGHNINDKTFIFTFHMPLFFLISGFLFSPKSPKTYLKKSAVRLLIPYVCFLLVISLPEICMGLYKADYGRLRSLFFRMLFGGEVLKGVYAVFWYVTVLWMSANLFNLILHKKVKYWLLPLLVCVAYLTCLVSYSLPWNIQVVPMATVYLWIGYILKQGIGNKVNGGGNKKLYSFLAVLVLIAVYICRETLTIDMKFNRMGIPILSLISSVLASVSVSYLAVFLTRWNLLSKVLIFMGSGSMVIMYLHMPIKFYFSYLLSRNHLEIFNIFLGIGVALLVYALLKNNNLGKKYFLGEV